MNWEELRLFLLLAACVFLSNLCLIAQTSPMFIYPSDGIEQIDLPNNFRIVVSSLNGNGVRYDIEISRSISFDPQQGNFDYQSSIASPRRFLRVRRLTFGEKYYIRTRAWDRFTGYGPYRLDSLTIRIEPLFTYVTNIINGSFLQQTSNSFEALNTPGVRRYEWEFNTSPNFDQTGHSITLSNRTNLVDVNWDNLNSGTQYYARVRVVARNGRVGRWTNEIDPRKVVTFTSPLHLTQVWGPRNLTVLNRTGFKVWVEPVKGSSGYTFQISDDPGFINVIDEQNSNKFWKDGRLIRGFDLDAEYFAYDYFGNPSIVPLEENKTYYIRVKAFNSFQTGNYGPYSIVFTGFSSSFVIKPVHLEKDLPSAFNLVAAKINTASSYTLQLDKSRNFDLNPIEFSSLDHNIYVRGLDYNSKYYARIKINSSSYGDSVTTFNTAPKAKIEVLTPKQNRVDFPIGASMYVNVESSANYYLWELDTQSDFNGPNKQNLATVSNRANFSLQENTGYYLRVRVSTNIPEILSNWSDTIYFSTEGTFPTPSINNYISSYKEDTNPIPEKFNSDLSISVVPNPLIHSFKVVGPLMNCEKLTIYDERGVEAISLSNLGNLTDKEFGKSLSIGMYTLIVIYENNTLLSGRFIKY